MKTNVSMLKTWMDCPLKAKFRYIDGGEGLQNAKASFGVIIHDALEQYNVTGDIDYAIERFKFHWDHPEELDVVPDVWPKNTDFGKLRNKGIDILEQYHGKNRWEDRSIVTQEHKFCVPMGDHLLSGIVDCIEVKTSGRGVRTLRVIDYKTNVKAPTIAQLRMDIQFTAYVYASMQPEFWLGNEEVDPKYVPLENGERMFRALEGVQRRAVWYDLWNLKEKDAGDRDDNDFLRLYRCITEVNNALEKEVYVPNISGDTCTFCDFTEECTAVSMIRDKMGEAFGGDDDEGMF